MNILVDEQWNNDLYIRVESDFNSSVPLLSIEGIQLKETLSSAGPTFNLQLIDALGEHVTLSHIAPHAVYDVYIGKTQDDAERTRFRLSRDEKENLAQGKLENIGANYVFMTDKWQYLIDIPYSRSWTDVKYSTVVSEIASELLYDDIDVETTQGRFNVIQANMSNHEMLKWLAMHSKNVDSVGGFDFCIGLGNRFWFRSYHDLYSQEPKTTYYLTGIEQTNKENQIFDFQVIYDYAPRMKQGGLGVNHMHFDFEAGEFVFDKKKVSETSQRQLSDWLYLPKEQELAEHFVDCGLDTESDVYAENIALHSMNSVQKVRTTVHGNKELHCGDIINLMIAPSEHFEEPINEMYSGYWMISEVKHKLDPKVFNFITEIELVRGGLNGVGDKWYTFGLSQTQTGKDISG